MQARHEELLRAAAQAWELWIAADAWDNEHWDALRAAMDDLADYVRLYLET